MVFYQFFNDIVIAIFNCISKALNPFLWLWNDENKISFSKNYFMLIMINTFWCTICTLHIPAITQGKTTQTHKTIKWKNFIFSKLYQVVILGIILKEQERIKLNAIRTVTENVVILRILFWNLYSLRLHADVFICKTVIQIRKIWTKRKKIR